MKIISYTLEEKYQWIRDNIVQATSTDPVEIAKGFMYPIFINIHGPEHHFLDGAAFLMAYYNATGEIDINKALDELQERTIKMPGAMCGLWGVCGAATSIGSALSIIHKTGPLSKDKFYKQHMQYTSSVIKRISEIGGPRCCKRNAFIALEMAIEFVNKNYHVDLEHRRVLCDFSYKNKQCIKTRCPYFNDYTL